jgi:alanine racemase
MSGAASVRPTVAGDLSEASGPAAIERDRVVMEVDLDAVARNAEVATTAAGGAQHVIAVLKGDGYGMGAATVAPQLEAIGIARFATDNAAEAVALRRAGIEGPIIVLYGEPPERVRVCAEEGLSPVIYDAEQAAACAAACAAQAKELQVWVGANIGFNRAGGAEVEEFAALVDALAAHAGRLRVVGVLAHLTSSHCRARRNAAELEAFDTRLAIARRRLGGELEASVFASHGLLRWERREQGESVRPGLMLSGEQCFTAAVLRAEPRAAELVSRLRPAVRIQARVIHLLETRSRQRLGYAPGVDVPRGRRLATVALGFRSGFPVGGRPVSAICRGRLAKRIGPLGMDSLQLDVTDVPGVAVGDWVTVSGREGAHHVPLARICAAAGMTPYQLLSRLRIPRSYRCTTTAPQEAST